MVPVPNGGIRFNGVVGFFFEVVLELERETCVCSFVLLRDCLVDWDTVAAEFTLSADLDLLVRLIDVCDDGWCKLDLAVCDRERLLEPEVVPRVLSAVV